MYPDQIYRAFLLKMGDADTDAAIEEGILDGSIDPTHLIQVEDELIDDSIFGRLSDEEQIHFTTDFLSTPERNARISFARALKQYSAQQFVPGPRVSVWNGWKRFAASPWSVRLAGALACALLVAGWLTERNLNLRNELARTSRENDEHQRIIASLRQDQERMHIPNDTAPSLSPHAMADSESHRSLGTIAGESGSEFAELPVIRLSNSVSRGLAAVPVLQIGRGASMVKIELNLAFNLPGTVREEILDSAGKSIWSQQFSGPNSIAPHGDTTIALPVALFTSGDYRLRMEAGMGREESAARVEYLFRVHRN